MPQLSQQILFEQLNAHFSASLPSWIDKSSFILESIQDSSVQLLSEVLFHHFVYSDFFNSIKAKLFKQDDYSLLENEQNINEFFKDKYKTIFRRGTFSIQEELSRLFMSQLNLLYYETFLTVDYYFNVTTFFKLRDSRTVQSGWIADFTYPSINSVELSAQITPSFDYVFTEKDFILLQATNVSDHSKYFLDSFIRRYIFPFNVNSIIDFNFNGQI